MKMNRKKISKPVLTESKVFNALVNFLKLTKNLSPEDIEVLKANEKIVDNAYKKLDMLGKEIHKSQTELEKFYRDNNIHE